MGNTGLFVSLGCLSKVPNLGWLPPAEMCGLSLETGSPKSRCLQHHAPSDSSRGGSFLISSSFRCFQQPLAFSPGMRLSSPSIHRGMLLEPWMPTLPLTKTISGLQMICSCSPLSQDHGSSGITFFLVLLPTWALPFHSHTAQFCLYEPILPSLLTPRATNSPGFFYSAPNWKNAIYVASMVLDRKMVSETSF